MKLFLQKLGIFMALFSLTAVVLILFHTYVVKDQYLGNYQASLLDKVERLQSIDEPKIILIGNSNLAFGINSQMLEEAMDMPVVNMGLHGGLGNAFHEEMLQFGLSEGDIVILSHIKYADEDEIADTELAWITLEHHAELWKILRPKDIWPMIKSYPQYYLSSTSLWLRGQGNQTLDDNCYSRSAFNEYGDIVYRHESSYTFTEKSVKVQEIDEECILRLNELNAWVESKDATLLLTAYPIADGQYTPPKKEFEDFERKLREQVDCEVISDFTDYMFPYEYFYNTAKHLTEEGADLRTKQLIEDLQVWQQKQKDGMGRRKNEITKE